MLFLCHSSMDYESFVLPLADRLESHDLTTWYCERDIPEGGNWAECIYEAITCSDCVLCILTDSVFDSPGQVSNELGLASQLNKRKLGIALTKRPIPAEIAYHLQLNVMRWYERPEEESLSLLLKELGATRAERETREKLADWTSTMSQVMATHTDGIFSDVADLGGFSWGLDKSIVQNLQGGWKPEDIRIEKVDNAPFDPEQSPLHDGYQSFQETPEYEEIVFKGRNHTRWMLTSLDTAYDQLFLSLRRTEWSHTTFVWHHLLANEDVRKEAINEFFDTEISSYPTSLCLHVVLIDANGAIVATKIKGRKRNDYPKTVAITIGEQLDETDFTTTESFVTQWLRRSLCEEFGFSQQNLPNYVDESSARVLSLDMEGDIYNFALVCCVRLKCTSRELYDYYKLHRSSEDEFDDVYAIPVDIVSEILANSTNLADAYHPSSFLRLLYGYWYLKGELPSFDQQDVEPEELALDNECDESGDLFLDDVPDESEGPLLDDGNDESIKPSCPRCGTGYTIGQLFCVNCGYRLEEHGAESADTSRTNTSPCPLCGSPNSPDAAFCVHCGHALNTYHIGQGGAHSTMGSGPSHMDGAPMSQQTCPQPMQYSSGYSSSGLFDAQKPRPAAASPSRKKREGFFGKLRSFFERKDDVDEQPVVGNPTESQLQAPRLSDVNFSAIAPEGLTPGKYAMVDIVMYESGWESVVRDVKAEHREPTTTTSSGWLKAHEGTRVRVELTCSELEYVDTQEGIWAGRYLRFSFPTRTSASFADNQALFIANVFFNDVPATRLSFVASTAPTSQNMGVTRSDINTAFVSYASEDRQRVATIVQGMQVARPDLDLFFDIESLRSGDDWEQVLRREIGNRDLLFLCWSRNAMASKWVDFEWRYALEQKGLSSIEPVAIEPPDLCPPPAELRSKHFNDRLLYVINYDQH